MTETAADAKPEPDWYVIYTAEGFVRCIDWEGEAYGKLPPGWTIVASITDLLRDAARYRHIRQSGMSRLVANTPEELDSLIDAELARKRKPEGRE